MSKNFVGNNIVLGITGSIAAYKAAELTRLYTQKNFQVQAVMSESAEKFIGAETFHALTKRKVIKSFWEDSGTLQGDDSIEHIDIATWADAIVIAPATAETIAKLAYGHSDSPLTAIALASKAQLIIAPAMNTNMLMHPATQENIAILKKRGVIIVDPTSGDLACGWVGSGRLAEPIDIYWHTRRALAAQDYKGKKILVTAGPTREAIDPVRYISNRSSGKMGVSIALEAFRRGAEVTLVHGPMTEPVPGVLKTVSVISASDMEKAIIAEGFGKSAAHDIVIMTAAVADYSAIHTSDTKIKRTKNAMTLDLKPNADILGTMGAKRGKSARPILVGFAVETSEPDMLLEEVQRKIVSKGVDLIVGNIADEAFENDTNRVWMVEKGGKVHEVATSSKSRIADKLMDVILKL